MAERRSADDFADRMSDSDALMWHIEKDPILRSTIVAVAILDEAPPWERLRDRIDVATLHIPRMRQRIVSPPFRLAPPRWAVDPDYDLAFHLRRVQLPAPSTQRSLLDYVTPLASTSFDRARPLWELTSVEGLDDGRAALVLKVHHSVTDGVGGMELLTRLVDLDADAPVEEDRPAAPIGEHVSRRDLLVESLGITTSRLASTALRLPKTATAAALGAARDPVGFVENLSDQARSIARTLAPAASPLSPLMRERSLSRRLDVLDASLDDLKRAAKAAEATLNDAFVAATVGGLSRYHLRHGAPTARLRMNMPINIRTESATAAGNQFVPARFGVPALVSSPAEHLAAIGALVRSWRGEPALALTDRLAGVLNRLPTTVTTALFGSMLKNVDITTSNVPGTPLPIYVAGSRVERFYAFGPPAGSAVNVTLVSHVDRICVGVVIDTAAVPDPDNLMDDLRSSFDEVIELGR